jgi:hypothetical protein
MIYEFRVRDGVRGVTTRHVDAPTLAEADAIATAWAAKKPGALFIVGSVQPWLVSLEELPVAPVEPAQTAGQVPSQKEQTERLKAAGAARKAGVGPGSDEKPASAERIGA